MEDWEKLPDAEKRRQLIRSYVGQQEYMFRRIARNERRISRRAKHVKIPPEKDLPFCWESIRRWQLRIERVKSGEPLENIVGRKLTKDG